jgi:formylglycine-generating enzyme required for sulfatase activity
LYKESLEATSWLVDNSNRQTHTVGTKQPNAWGIYDMYGNVFEWIQDENLDQPRDGTGLGAGNFIIDGPSTRRIRRGSWFSTSVFSRTSYRMGLTRDRRLSTLGFRIVREK